ncbi:MAG: hypothetical protein M1G31_15925 [Pseudanabaena sp. Salubria-1]|nr:hypothetical protein [Pseudanabaena sp. Salubria-1]
MAIPLVYTKKLRSLPWRVPPSVKFLFVSIAPAQKMVRLKFWQHYNSKKL